LSAVEEFAERRGLMRMPQQENHEVFSSLQMWLSVPWTTFQPGWMFSESFDGRLLLLPFFHRAQSAADVSDYDVTLVLHMDASRLKNLDLVVRSWRGPISVVVMMCVHPPQHMPRPLTLLSDTLLTQTLLFLPFAL
jgi:hypothetical protein